MTLPRRHARGALAAAAFLLTCTLQAAAPRPAGAAVPLALPDPGLVVDQPLQARRVRALEAESKARAAAASMAAVSSPAAVAAKAAQEGWDVTFYDLDLDVDPATHLLSGTVAVEARVAGADVAAIDLDLRSTMTVTAVRVGGQAAAWVRPADLVSVTLDRPYAAGEIFRVEVDYAGDPAGGYFGWSSYAGQPLVWTLSEPYGARQWWPCKDVNTDKADSVAVRVTVDDPLVVVSNGLLVGQTAPESGRTTFHWRSRYPIATYLVSLAIHPYVLVEDAYTTLDGGTMPVQNFLFPAWEAAGAAGYAVVVDQLTAFAAAFGEYPFVEEKYGHAHWLIGGGMEHQTCSSMLYSYYQPWFLAHELGHQWFGDLITCSDFHHIWLNEGFATWCEAYWREVSEGPAGYRAEMNAAAYFGPGTVYVDDATDVNRIFDHDLSYNKASWVVHMLRGVMGDVDFFAGLAEYRQQYGFGAADTGQFQAVMQDVSGLDLEPFFQQWIYGEYFPSYFMSWGASPRAGGGDRVTVNIRQLQAQAGLFTMPLQLRITDAQGLATTFTVANSAETEWYVLDVAGTAVNVELDPDGWVLCTKATGLIADAAVPGVSAATITGAAPNPFNPRTEIRFALPTAGAVRLDIHDAAGRRVRTLADGVFDAGPHAVAWDGRDDGGRTLGAGTYLVRLRSGVDTDVRKITLVK